MRTLLFTLLFSFTLQYSVQAQSKSLGEFVYNVPLKKNIAPKTLQTEWWNEYLEWPVFNNLFGDLLHRIDSGKIQVMSPEYPFTKTASPEEVKNALHKFDSSQVMDADGANFQLHVSETDLAFSDITSISFCEEWFLDEAKMSFTKKVKGFILNKLNLNNSTGEVIGEKPLFYVPLEPSYHANEKSEKKPADIRTVSFFTYYPHYFESFNDQNKIKTEVTQQNFLISALQSYAEKNKKIISDTLFPYTSHPKKKQLKELISKLSTANNIKFYEEWDLDINKLSFEKKVKGIILVDEKIKNDTATRKEIAFIPLNGYIPSSPINMTSIKVNKFSSDLSFCNYSSFKDWMVFNKIDHSDSSKLMSAAAIISDAVMKGKVPSFSTSYFDDPWNPENHILKTAAEVNATFFTHDTIMSQNLNTGEFETSVQENQLLYKNILGFRFFESWDFDLEKLHFDKKIKSMGPLFLKTNQSEVIGYRTLFDVDIPDVDQASIMSSKNNIGKNISYQINIDWDIRNANPEFATPEGKGIIWQENWVNNLYQYEYYPLVQGSIDAVMSGKIKAMDPEKNQALNVSDLKLKLNTLKDSSFVKPKDLSTDYTLVNSLKFSEDWYFDPTTYGFYKKVNSITFVHIARKYNSQTMKEDIKENPIFTLNLN